MPDEDEVFRWPRIREETIEHVAALLRAGRTSFDLEIFEAFEAEVARAFGVRHALACVNGTAACFSAMRGLQIGSGDKVIVPALTHWASILPALQCGARVAVADVMPGTSHLDPTSVCRLIDAHTRAVVVTHMWGEPVALGELRTLCDQHGLVLIEDVSHAHGATFAGRPVGSFGDAAFCSFQKKKIVSGGEGGALLTNDDEVYYRAMAVGNSCRLFRGPERWRSLANIGFGFKFRPSPVLVTLAQAGLAELPAQNEVRNRACGELRARLARMSYFEGLDRPAAGRVYFCCELLLARRAPGMLEAMQAERLRVRAYQYPFLPDHPEFCGVFKTDGELPVARDVKERLLLVDPFTAYSAEVIDRYARTIERLCGAR